MVRIIAKLDVKPPNVVKPVHFEGLRKIGLPKDVAEQYYLQGADEIMYIDIVASLYQRNILLDPIRDTVENLYVPFSVGGGVRTIQDFSDLFHSGADKVVINTHALQQKPDIIDEAAKIFGSQSVVVNIEAKSNQDDWVCFTDCGRIPSSRSVLDWAHEAQERGAGEILLQSVDRDGRRRGFDKNLVKLVVDRSSVPVIAASGAGAPEDILDLVMLAKPSGVAVSSILHYGVSTIAEIKAYLSENGVEVSQ